MELDYKLLFSILGIDSPSSLDRLIRAVETMTGVQLGYADLPGDVLEIGEWIIGDENYGVLRVAALLFLVKDGKGCVFGDLFTHLLNSQKMGQARSHYPTESRTKDWQLASAINATMILIGPSYGWKMTEGGQVAFGGKGEEEIYPIAVDDFVPFVRNILSTWDVLDLSSPSKVYGALIALSSKVN